MNVFLAGERTEKNGKLANWHGLNILESYYYIRNNKEFSRLIKDYRMFLLDSGAFTFLSKAKSTVNWEEYIHEYADFINKYNIEYFFELDIDSLVGLEEVERLRGILEDLTGKKCIPVWHKNRGREYFEWMCQNYPYVAIGGIVTKEIPIHKYEPLFPWFINTAHKYGARIHGLGYTNLNGLRKYKFDSVDSTAWIYGNMSGKIYKFNPFTGYIDSIRVPQGKKLRSADAAAHNFREWVKFQHWAIFNL